MSTSAFLDDFASLLDSLFLEAALLLLVGDFNIWMEDRTAGGGTSPMLDLLAANNLTQHVVCPTHRADHTLDLMLTKASETTISRVDWCDPGLSDHLAIMAKLLLRKPPLLRKRVLTRSYKRVCVDDLRHDIQQCELLRSLPDDMSLAAAHYIRLLWVASWTSMPLSGRRQSLCGQMWPGMMMMISMRPGGSGVGWSESGVSSSWRSTIRSTVHDARRSVG